MTVPHPHKHSAFELVPPRFFAYSKEYTDVRLLTKLGSSFSFDEMKLGYTRHTRQFQAKALGGLVCYSNLSTDFVLRILQKPQGPPTRALAPPNQNMNSRTMVLQGRRSTNFRKSSDPGLSELPLQTLGTEIISGLRAIREKVPRVVPSLLLLSDKSLLYPCYGEVLSAMDGAERTVRVDILNVPFGS